jgi:hypothetical protein
MNRIEVGFAGLASKFAAIAVMAILCFFPMTSKADSDKEFGDYVVHYSAISTTQLVRAIAKQYGIERSPKNGLLNISVEQKSEMTHTVNADITAEVGDLTGHDKSIRMRETNENGDIDYLGEFALDGSGTYVFTVKVSPPGKAQPFVVKFTQDFVID